MDNSYSEVIFYNLKGKSYSNSFQAELILEPIKRLEINAAYRINNVKMTIDNDMKQKPFVNKYKALISASYRTMHDKWQFDFTTQYNDGIRLPNTNDLPAKYRQSESAPSFYLLSAMITKRFRRWDVYIGAENMTDYKQSNPIIASDDPFGSYFDSSFVWGPIVGRSIYIGMRFLIK